MRRALVVALLLLVASAGAARAWVQCPAGITTASVWGYSAGQGFYADADVEIDDPPADQIEELTAKALADHRPPPVQRELRSEWHDLDQWQAGPGGAHLRCDLPGRAPVTVPIPAGTRICVYTPGKMVCQ